MKRLLSLLLALVLVLSLLPGVPLRAEAKTGGKLLALTFDDGPSSKYTTQLLDGLKERGVPVTFFFLGEMAEDNRAIVRRAYEEGHEIACHTWDHPNLTKCSTSEVKKQIEDTFEELDRACPSMEWLEMVVKCRSDVQFRQPYDIVTGKIANDNVGETVMYVVYGVMRKEDAVERLKFEKINNQIAFCTEEALKQLSFIKSYIVEV